MTIKQLRIKHDDNNCSTVSKVTIAVSHVTVCFQIDMAVYRMFCHRCFFELDSFSARARVSVRTITNRIPCSNKKGS